MSTWPQRRHFSPEEYLLIERQAAHKSELINGEIYAMSGASREHNLITGNIFASLHSQLRGKGCEVYTSDMRLKIPATGTYTYPNVVLVCGEPQFEDEHVDTLINPTVLIEVLSPSTEKYDRSPKSAHYRHIPSLQELILVSQEERRVEHWVREGEGNEAWVGRVMDDPQGAIALESVGCTLALTEVYERL